jgi:hypothetical protein
MDQVIPVLVYLGFAYVALGLLFAVPFAFRFVNRLDPDARDGSLGFRLLIIPGAAALWPLLLRRVLRRDGSRPVECTAHRRAARGGQA